MLGARRVHLLWLATIAAVLSASMASVGVCGDSPVITSTLPEQPPADTTSSMLIGGTNLGGDATQVTLDGQQLAVQPLDGDCVLVTIQPLPVGTKSMSLTTPDGTTSTLIDVVDSPRSPSAVVDATTALLHDIATCELDIVHAIETRLGFQLIQSHLTAEGLDDGRTEALG